MAVDSADPFTPWARREREGATPACIDAVASSAAAAVRSKLPPALSVTRSSAAACLVDADEKLAAAFAAARKPPAPAPEPAVRSSVIAYAFSRRLADRLTSVRALACWRRAARAAVRLSTTALAWN